MAIKRRSSEPKVLTPVKKRRIKQRKISPYNRLQVECRRTEIPTAKLTIKVLRFSRRLRGFPRYSPHDDKSLRDAQSRSEHIRGMPTAIVAECIQCRAPSLPRDEAKVAVRECDFITCPLWAFRLGHDPLHGKSKVEVLD